MDLLELKKSAGLTWSELAAKAGVPVGNLHHVAHGRKWFGPETAEGMMRLGIDMNDMVRSWLRQAAEHAAAKKEAA